MLIHPHFQFTLPIHYLFALFKFYFLKEESNGSVNFGSTPLKLYAFDLRNLVLLMKSMVYFSLPINAGCKIFHLGYVSESLTNVKTWQHMITACFPYHSIQLLHKALLVVSFIIFFFFNFNPNFQL